MTTTRELTQEDVTEAWRLLSIVTGKESAARAAGSEFQSAKTEIDKTYNDAERRAQANYTKSVGTAQTSRVAALANAQVALTKADDAATKARQSLAKHQSKVEEETGAIPQLPIASGGGSVRV